MKLRITGPARRDIKAALAWSLDRFGPLAQGRYRDLIGRALSGLAESSGRVAIARPELGAGIMLFHLRRARGEPATVRAPRHFLVLRIEDDSIIVLRLLHDAMDLPSHMADEP